MYVCCWLIVSTFYTESCIDWHSQSSTNNIDVERVKGKNSGPSSLIPHPCLCNRVFLWAGGREKTVYHLHHAAIYNFYMYHFWSICITSACSTALFWSRLIIWATSSAFLTLVVPGLNIFILSRLPQIPAVVVIIVSPFRCTYVSFGGVRIFRVWFGMG
jgi:hypothetical protein